MQLYPGLPLPVRAWWNGLCLLRQEFFLPPLFLREVSWTCTCSFPCQQYQFCLLQWVMGAVECRCPTSIGFGVPHDQNRQPICMNFRK